MIDHKNEIDLGKLGDCRLKHTGKTFAWLWGLAVFGSIAALVNTQFIDNAEQRFFQGYLVAFAFVLSISLGAMFFVLVQHLMRAGWGVIVRRFSEIFCLNILVVLLLFLPIAWSVWQGDGLVYSWAKYAPVSAAPHVSLEEEHFGRIHPVSYTDAEPRVETHELSKTHEAGEAHESGEAHAAHKPWLNRYRFLVTWAVLFFIWIGIAVFYYRNSVAQDKAKGIRLTLRMEWWSGIATLLFGFTLTFGAFDLLMMLDPTWFSTIFGVYFFSGCAVAGMATLLLSVIFLNRMQIVPDVFTDELQRDLGRLLFAFVFFWAYIAFSQYMLLWYADMPETTGWLVKRGMSTATGYTNSWGWLAIALLVAHFIVPFCGFMSRHVKSNSNWMVFWAIWLMVLHYLDLYWIVIPEYNGSFTISFVEIGTALAVIAVYGISAVSIASRSNLFAAGDPRMIESLSRHSMY